MFGSRQSLGNSSPWISLADAGKALWTLNCMKSDREIWIGRRFSLWLVWLLVVLVFACLVMSGIDVPPGAKRQAHSGQQKPNEKIPCVPRSPKPGACRGRRRADRAQSQEAVSNGAPPEPAVARARTLSLALVPQTPT